MVVQSWHLVVIVLLAALVVWGLVASRRRTLLGLAAALVAMSGFALYALVLDESNLDRDRNGQMDVLAFIGIPAILGIGLLLAVRRAGKR